MIEYLGYVVAGAGLLAATGSVRAKYEKPVISKIKSLKDKTFSPRKAKSDELFPGCPRPSTLLAQLIAGKILREPWSSCYSSSLSQRDASYSICKWSHEDITISWTLYRHGTVLSYTFRHRDVTLSFEKEEQAVILEAMKKAKELQKAFDENKKKAEDQQRALSAIESIMKLPASEIKEIAA